MRTLLTAGLLFLAACSFSLGPSGEEESAIGVYTLDSYSGIKVPRAVTDSAFCPIAGTANQVKIDSIASGVLSVGPEFAYGSTLTVVGRLYHQVNGSWILDAPKLQTCSGGSGVWRIHDHKLEFLANVDVLGHLSIWQAVGSTPISVGQTINVGVSTFKKS